MNQVKRIAEMIEADESSVKCLSTGEQIAAALLFNRLEWLPLEYRHPLDAIDRLGDKWLKMIIDYRNLKP